MNAKELCKKIEKVGGILVRTCGSHRQYKLINGNTVTVPYPRKDVAIGTLKSILKQAGILI